MTPKEIISLIDAYIWNQEEKYKMAGWTAWHIAALDRQKRLPKLEKIMGNNKKNKRQITLDEKLAKWNALIEK